MALNGFLETKRSIRQNRYKRQCFVTIFLIVGVTGIYFLNFRKLILFNAQRTSEIMIRLARVCRFIMDLRTSEIIIRLHRCVGLSWIYFSFKGSFGLLSDILSSETHSSVWIFQGNEEKDFPTVETDVQRIPHIIHQYYSSEYVPEKYVPYIKTFTNMNPKWEYRLWTHASGRKLLEKHHPYLIEKYDCLGNTVQNTNIVRFLVLYHYGGIYADLDVEVLRPLDKVTLKYSCIFPPEPFEHSVLGYKMEFAVQTATVMCRKFHPILKLILSNMQDVSCTAPTQFNTGVAFITKQFMIYHNVTTADLKDRRYIYAENSPFFYRGHIKEDNINAVFVPNTQYFSESLAPKVLRRLPLVCSIYYIQSYDIKRACNEFYRRQQLRRKGTYAFLKHHWFNSYNVYKQIYFKSLQTVHIHDVVPHTILTDD